MSFVRLGKAAAAGKRYCPHHFGSGVSLHSSLHVLAAAGGTGLLEYDCHPDAGGEIVVGACYSWRTAAFPSRRPGPWRDPGRRSAESLSHLAVATLTHYRASSIMNPFEQDPAALRIGFVGAGRLGTALAWSFAQHGLRVVAVASMIASDAERLAASIAASKLMMNGQPVVDACDLVFVTTPDGAIAETTAQFHWRPGMAVVHCSGVTDVS